MYAILDSGLKGNVTSVFTRLIWDDISLWQATKYVLVNSAALYRVALNWCNFKSCSASHEVQVCLIWSLYLLRNYLSRNWKHVLFGYIYDSSRDQRHAPNLLVWLDKTRRYKTVDMFAGCAFFQSTAEQKCFRDKYVHTMITKSTPKVASRI